MKNLSIVAVLVGILTAIGGFNMQNNAKLMALRATINRQAEEIKILEVVLDEARLAGIYGTTAQCADKSEGEAK